LPALPSIGSERRYHLAGWVGAEICRRCGDLGWIVRAATNRAVRLTSAGRVGLFDMFGSIADKPFAPAARYWVATQTSVTARKSP